MIHYSISLLYYASCIEKKETVLLVSPTIININSMKMAVFLNFFQNEYGNTDTKRTFEKFIEINKLDTPEDTVWMVSQDPAVDYSFVGSKLIESNATNEVTQLIKDYVLYIDIIDTLKSFYQLLSEKMEKVQNLLKFLDKNSIFYDFALKLEQESDNKPLSFDQFYEVFSF